MSHNPKLINNQTNINISKITIEDYQPYTYDKNNLTSATNPKGETTTYSYDDINRLTTSTYANGNTINYSYDKNGNMITLATPTPTNHAFGYNGVNKNTSYTSPLNKATQYEYDKQRRVTKVTKQSSTPRVSGDSWFIALQQITNHQTPLPRNFTRTILPR